MDRDEVASSLGTLGKTFVGVCAFLFLAYLSYSTFADDSAGGNVQAKQEMFRGAWILLGPLWLALFIFSAVRAWPAIVAFRKVLAARYSAGRRVARCSVCGKALGASERAFRWKGKSFCSECYEIVRKALPYEMPAPNTAPNSVRASALKTHSARYK